MRLVPGKTYYRATGEAVLLDHIHNEVAYVRPIQIMQTTNYSGDDYEEHEVEADFCLSVDPIALFESPPKEKIDQKIEELRSSVSLLEQEQKKMRDETASVKNALVMAQSNLSAWRKVYPIVEELATLLEGGYLWPLEVTKTCYDKVIWIPKALSMSNDVNMLKLKKKKWNDGFMWAAVGRGYTGGDVNTEVEFFKSPEARDQKVVSLFETVCALFREKPDYAAPTHTTTTRRSYNQLKKWVAAYGFLTIPDDIEAGKLEHDEHVKIAKIAQARKQLEELEYDS